MTELVERPAKRLREAADKIDELERIKLAAHNLVSLWQSQKIEGLPRAERNVAIEQIRGHLILMLAPDSAPHAGEGT